MYLVAVAWIYVVLMMALAEAVSPQGTLLGAFFTALLYGAVPLSILLYIGTTPARRRARRAAEAAADAEAAALADLQTPASSDTPDGRGHAPGDAVATERKVV